MPFCVCYKLFHLSYSGGACYTILFDLPTVKQFVPPTPQQSTTKSKTLGVRELACSE